MRAASGARRVRTSDELATTHIFLQKSHSFHALRRIPTPEVLAELWCKLAMQQILTGSTANHLMFSLKWSNLSGGFTRSLLVFLDAVEHDDPETGSEKLSRCRRKAPPTSQRTLGPVTVWCPTAAGSGEKVARSKATRILSKSTTMWPQPT